MAHAQIEGFNPNIRGSMTNLEFGPYSLKYETNSQKIPISILPTAEITLKGSVGGYIDTEFLSKLNFLSIVENGYGNYYDLLTNGDKDKNSFSDRREDRIYELEKHGYIQDYLHLWNLATNWLKRGMVSFLLDSSSKMNVSYDYSGIGPNVFTAAIPFPNPIIGKKFNLVFEYDVSGCTEDIRVDILYRVANSTPTLSIAVLTAGSSGTITFPTNTIPNHSDFGLGFTIDAVPANNTQVLKVWNVIMEVEDVQHSIYNINGTEQLYVPPYIDETQTYKIHEKYGIGEQEDRTDVIYAPFIMNSTIK